MRMSGPFRLPSGPEPIRPEPYEPDDYVVPLRRGTWGGDYTTGTSMTLNTENTLAGEPGDYILVLFHTLNGAVPSANNGFTLLGQASYPGDSSYSCFLFGGFRPTSGSVTFSWTGSTRNLIIATALAGIDPSDPVASVTSHSGDVSTTQQFGPFEYAPGGDCRGLFGVMGVAKPVTSASVLARAWRHPEPPSKWYWSHTTRSIEFVTFPFPGASEVARSPILDPAVSGTHRCTGVYAVLRKAKLGRLRYPPVVDLSGMTDNYDAPTMLYVLTKDGEEVESGVLGRAATSGGGNAIPVTMDTPCHFFSLSKIITEACVRRLAQDGLLDLDDPALDHLPAEFTAAAHASFAPVTIRQLLQMRSGYQGTPYDLFGNDLLGLALGWVGNTFTNPGDRNERYENGCFAVLDYVIRHRSGMSYWDYARQTVIEPLGMSSVVDYVNPRTTMTWNVNAATHDTYPSSLVSTAVWGWGGTVRDIAKLALILTTDKVLDAAMRQDWLSDNTRLEHVCGTRASAYRHTGAVTVAGAGARARFYLLESGYALATFWNAAQVLTPDQIGAVLDSFLIEGPEPIGGGSGPGIPLELP